MHASRLIFENENQSIQMKPGLSVLCYSAHGCAQIEEQVTLERTIE